MRASGELTEHVLSVPGAPDGRPGRRPVGGLAPADIFGKGPPRCSSSVRAQLAQGSAATAPAGWTTGAPATAREPTRRSRRRASSSTVMLIDAKNDPRPVGVVFGEREAERGHRTYVRMNVKD